MSTLRIVDNDDDWMGVYMGDILVYQGHSISTTELLELLNIEYEHRKVDTEWMYRVGHLPDNIAEVKWDEEV